MTDVTRGTREYLMIMRKNDGCEKEILRAIMRDARKDHGQKMEREKSCGDEKQPAKDVSAGTSMDSKNAETANRKTIVERKNEPFFPHPSLFRYFFFSFFFLPSPSFFLSHLT